MNGHIVYKHTLKSDGRVYIGQTWRTSERWKDNGRTYCNCPRFWDAIQEYGWDSFEHDVLYSNLTKEEADVVERVLIRHYNSADPQNGFNVMHGGRGCLTKCRTDDSYKKRFGTAVVQYSLEGIKLCEFESADIAEINTGIAYTSIIKCCLNKAITAGNYLWGFVGDDPPKPPKRRPGVARKVIQMDLNANTIAVFKSAMDASKQTGVSESSIWKVCNGKANSSCGYMWAYIKE